MEGTKGNKEKCELISSFPHSQKEYDRYVFLSDMRSNSNLGLGSSVGEFDQVNHTNEKEREGARGTRRQTA